MDQLLAETISAAEKLFKGLPIRIWYIKAGDHSWKSIVINTENKITLAKGAVRKSPEGAVTALRNQLESIVGRNKKIS